VNGEPLPQPAPGNVVRVDHAWNDGDRVDLHLPMTVRISRWHERSAAVERGPLVFALKRNEIWTQVTGTEPYVDYEIRTDERWNYGLLNEDLENPQEVYGIQRREPAGQPWSVEGAPLEIVAQARRIPEWQRYGGITGPLPWSPIPSSEPDEQVTLIPYGCTKIRISEFPVAV